MLNSYSKKDRVSARKFFRYFNFFDSISVVYTFLTVSNLYLIKLNVGNGLLGFYSSLPWLSLSFMPLSLVFHHGDNRISRMYRRYFAKCIIFLAFVFVVMLYNSLNIDIFRPVEYWFIGGLVGFFILRGMGLTVQNPLINEISEGTDKGDWLSIFQIEMQFFNAIPILIFALVLQINNNFYIYNIFFAIGILMFVLKVITLTFVKDPDVLPIKKLDIRLILKDSISDSTAKKFFLINMFSFFVFNFSAPFFIYYAKSVYGISDGVLTFLTLFINIGVIGIGYLEKSTIEKLGPKPFMVFATFSYFILILINILVTTKYKYISIAFFIIKFLLIGIGKGGYEISSQNYFFRITKPENQINMNVFLSFLQGISVLGGSVLGGIFLDFLIKDFYKDDIKMAFNVFFLINLLLLFLLIVAQRFLDRVNSKSIGSSLLALNPIYFTSFKNIRKIQEKDVQNIEQETEIIKRIGESKNNILLSDLTNFLKSPFYTIKIEALIAMEKMELDSLTILYLIEEIKKRPKEISFIIARILGKAKHEKIKCINALRAIALDSNENDYILKSHSIVALGNLKDEFMLDYYKDIIDNNKSKHLIILQLINSIKNLNISECIEPLIYILNDLDLKKFPNIDDEIVVSLSAILGFEKKFYKKYVDFLENKIDIFDELKLNVKVNVNLIDNFENVEEFKKIVIENHSDNRIIMKYLLNQCDNEKIRFLILILTNCKNT